MQEAIKKQLHLAVWRNWQTRLIQNQVSYGREGSSPFTAISGIALVCIFPQAFAGYLSSTAPNSTTLPALTNFWNKTPFWAVIGTVTLIVT